MTVVQEVLGACRVVKAFGREDDEHRRFVEHAAQCMGGHNRLGTSAVGLISRSPW